jgi:hypothetical protein
VVTKQRRRSQLAKAGAQRQQLRRAERDRRRRRRRALLTGVAVVVVAAALVTWIVLHARDSGSASAGRGDYASFVDLSHHLSTDQATTPGGTR